ncbi:carboxypeptidase-like regulatory domain-containing protein [Chryseobacterium gregarium]|uniref:carboxypeptidase-like regulatory domain-containing protein n=1 Tax=Chryseobacterium gregarium TaxID=456299 RepID=UPI000401F420|nr:carboxypeptidase-like regulatory domain-containing protein [Chryseobacterium gregarium]
MKRIFILFSIISTLLPAQKIQVIDAENNKPIGNARIILENKVVYTNDDGFAPVEPTGKNLEISAAGFQKQNLSSFTALVKLKPSFKDIEEVKMVNVDIKTIFEDVFKNYHKRYFDDPSLYDITLKQRAFDNDKLHFMVIAEAKLWSGNNMYNWKNGIKKNYDDIVQIQLNNIKYLKNSKSDSIFSQKTDEFSHEIVGNFFFNFEIYRTLLNLRNKATRFSGNLISDDGEEQVINCKIKSSYGTDISGEIRYNKKDKVITGYEFTYLQGDFPTEKKVTADGKEFSRKLGNATIKFEFYKKDGVYLPSLNSLNTDNFVIFYKDQVHTKKASREIVYNSFSKSDQKGLESKIDFNKSIWENIPVKEDKETTILLSREEQEFINQNNRL